MANTDQTFNEQLDKYEFEVERLLGNDNAYVSLQNPLEVQPLDTKASSFERAMANVNTKLDYLRSQVQRKINSMQQMNRYNAEQLDNFVNELRDSQVLPLDDVMCLVGAMTQLKAQNMELLLRVKSMEATMDLHKQQQLEQQMKQKSQEEEVMVMNPPAAGAAAAVQAGPPIDLLDQIENFEIKVKKQDTAALLAKSMQNGGIMASFFAKPAEPEKPKVISPQNKFQLAQDRADQDLLLNTIVKAYKNDMRVNQHLRDERYAPIEVFRKMRQHCNFVADLGLEDMNDPDKLRDMVKNISYILALTAVKSETLSEQKKQLQVRSSSLSFEMNNAEQLHIKLENVCKRLANKGKETEQNLQQAEAQVKRIFDIDFDTY